VIDSLHIVAVVLFLGGAAVGVFAWRQATTPRMRTYAGGSAVFCLVFCLYAATSSWQRSLAPAYQGVAAGAYLAVAIAFFVFMFRFGPRPADRHGPRK
jgi:hypothetical protein